MNLNIMWRMIMGILSGNPKEEPMHYGEVFDVWAYLASANTALAGYQTLKNHTGDTDLRKFIEDTERDLRDEIEQVSELLKENEVALPPAPPERPIAKLEDIPVGARFNDPEIAMSLSKDLAIGLVGCSQVMGKCIREDIAMLFGKFHATKVLSGAKLLRLNKEKGWLVPPPLHLVKVEE